MTDVDQSDRRGLLRAVKLRALVRDHLGRDVDAQLGAFPPGAALVESDTAWVLLEDAPDHGLGAAVAWAVRHGATRVQVLAGRDTGLLARRAAGLRIPVTVWHVEGRSLLPAVVEPPVIAPAARPEHLTLIPTIVVAGATPVVEHGVVTGEVRGLEVCRVVDDPHGGAVRLEVGVGAHDREAFAIIHGDVPTPDALAGVVQAVADHRRPDAPAHPLHRLAPERLLRWQVEQDPSALGLATLVPIPPPVPRPNVKDRVPCSAIGRRDDGRRVLVVCSVGVDLDLVPYAIDARLSALQEDTGPGAEGVGEVWLVMPPRDLVPVTVELAALAEPAMSPVPFAA
ncbi:MAG: hypothetical protein ABW328_12570 [Ilumatobacteraceae bacterium]